MQPRFLYTYECMDYNIKWSKSFDKLVANDDSKAAILFVLVTSICAWLLREEVAGDEFDVANGLLIVLIDIGELFVNVVDVINRRVDGVELSVGCWDCISSFCWRFFFKNENDVFLIGCNW